MSKIIFTLLIFLISLTLTAQKNDAINKIPNNKGIVRFVLYTEKGFLETPILRETGTIKNGSYF